MRCGRFGPLSSEQINNARLFVSLDGNFSFIRPSKCYLVSIYSCQVWTAGWGGEGRRRINTDARGGLLSRSSSVLLMDRAVIVQHSCQSNVCWIQRWKLCLPLLFHSSFGWSCRVVLWALVFTLLLVLCFALLWCKGGERLRVKCSHGLNYRFEAL